MTDPNPNGPSSSSQQPSSNQPSSSSSSPSPSLISTLTILDGGLGSELENHGVSVGSSLLWSAEVLDTNPHILNNIHREYIDAGADVVMTASYQASVPGFVKHFKHKEEQEGKVRKADEQDDDLVEKAQECIKRSVQVAQKARDEFWQEYTKTNSSASSLIRKRPLVAASIGPYGAFLGKGEEYTGKYNLPADSDLFSYTTCSKSKPATVESTDEPKPKSKSIKSFFKSLKSTPSSQDEATFSDDEASEDPVDNLSPSEQTLYDFHTSRLEPLIYSYPDILAIETIPNALELKVLRIALMKQAGLWNLGQRVTSRGDDAPHVPFPKTWMALSLDTTSYDKLADGTSFEQVAELLFPSHLATSCQPLLFDAVGINCLPPHRVAPALALLKKALEKRAEELQIKEIATLPLIVYPNSGEIYDGITKEWHSNPDFNDDQQAKELAEKKKGCFHQYLNEWYSLGARIVGGCCRTGPKDITEIRSQYINM